MESTRLNGWALLAVGLVAGTTLGAPMPEAHADYLPQNDLHLQDHLYLKQSNVSEAEFNRRIDDVVAVYGPLAQKFGGKMQARKKWEDNTVNARATQMLGSWILEFTGGLARRPEITADGFQLVVCHETGHHFGGFSFGGSPLDQIPIPGFPSIGGSKWAANEGQADYFASQVCARRLWAPEVEINASYRKTVVPAAQMLCDQAWKSEAEQNLCYRIAAAGDALGHVMAAAGKDPTIPLFDTPDPSVVPKTVDGHPKKNQCRLDTTMAGAMCSANYVDTVIPGKGNKAGEGSVDAERESSQYTCMKVSGHAVGLRPACWYKPRI